MIDITDKTERKTVIVNLVKGAGIIGAGGAGFPTYVKLSASADIVIANGAECEPILETDRHLLLREANKVIGGLKLAMEAVSAGSGIIAIKRKHEDVIEIIKELVKNEEGIELFQLENFYPVGDEHVLVYEATRRVVPMGGIPLDVGVVVVNAFTLSQVSDAMSGGNFTHRYVTIAGEVRNPCVARLPLGMSIREAIEDIAGGTLISQYRVIIGGPMMGKLEDDLGKPIVKTTGGILVLPSNHKLVRDKSCSLSSEFKRAKSVCCQCNICTEMCPRYLLGHNLKPHMMMRSVSRISENIDISQIQNAALCCECGLCSTMACTMGLSPNLVNSYLKTVIARSGERPNFKNAQMNEVTPYRQLRKVPTHRLVERLGLTKYDRHLPFVDSIYSPKRVVLPLEQHIGAESIPTVSVGDRVISGKLIAGIPKGKLGANLHSSIDGIVIEINQNIVIENV